MTDRAAVRAAARNNAEWCDIVCRAHGTAGEFHADMWTSARRTPPFYPDAVTLEDRVSPERILDHVDIANPGCSVKDSFASLDLSPSGFSILFNAEWIYRSPDLTPPSAAGGTRWERVCTAELLSAWEAAWAGDGPPSELFRPQLLDLDSVCVLAERPGDRVVGGAILNRSESVVGVSNLFTTASDVRQAWAGCLAAVAGYVPGVPVVAYEQGEALAAAHDLGFASIGPLRVWMATAV